MNSPACHVSHDDISSLVAACLPQAPETSRLRRCIVATSSSASSTWPGPHPCNCKEPAQCVCLWAMDTRAGPSMAQCLQISTTRTQWHDKGSPMLAWERTAQGEKLKQTLVTVTLLIRCNLWDLPAADVVARTTATSVRPEGASLGFVANACMPRRVLAVCGLALLATGDKAARPQGRQGESFPTGAARDIAGPLPRNRWQPCPRSAR